MAEQGRVDHAGAVMDLIPICAWCWRGQPRTLTILDGTPAELALLAIEAEEGLTHGICEEHYQQALEQAGLR